MKAYLWKKYTEQIRMGPSVEGILDRRIYIEEIGDILQKGQIKSIHNWQECLKRLVSVDEAKEVCENHSEVCLLPWETRMRLYMYVVTLVPFLIKKSKSIFVRTVSSNYLHNTQCFLIIKLISTSILFHVTSYDNKNRPCIAILLIFALFLWQLCETYLNDIMYYLFDCHVDWLLSVMLFEFYTEILVLQIAIIHYRIFTEWFVSTTLLLL